MLIPTHKHHSRILGFVLGICLWLGALGTHHLTAQPIDLETAKQRARTFFSTAQQSRSTQKVRRMLAQHEEVVAKQQGCTWLLCGSDGAFVLAAADKSLPPVLGYGSHAGQQLPPALRFPNNANWYTSASPVPQRPTQPVGPLLPMIRHQSAPYNAHCPFYRHEDGTLSSERCVVGCVATALEEIITYYRRPVELLDTLHGWSTDHYDIADVLPGTRVETAGILNDYDGLSAEEAEEVARLSYLCGVAAHMNWGLEESGANICNLPEPLRRAFGWQYAHCLDSYKFRPQDWHDLLDRELHAGRPVLYTGYTMKMAGHAFVVDGLDAQGFYHVNWGYGGDFDGYFCLETLYFGEDRNHMTEQGMYDGFFCNQQALVLCPDSVAEALPDTLARTGWEIAVDSVRWEQPPTTRKYTQMQLYLRNTTEDTLTTPLEIFTNAPEDTAYFEQGDYVALTGLTMGPKESRRLTITTNFRKAGERVLRISPDDVAVIWEQPMSVAEGQYTNPETAAPIVQVLSDNTLRASVEMSNTSAERAGTYLVLCLLPEESMKDETEINHTHYVFLEAGEHRTYSSDFTHLKPGRKYTLVVRQPWTVRYSVDIRMPDATGVNEVETETLPDIWYLPDGRRAAHPQAPGVYLRKRGSRVKKIYWELP